MERTDCRRQAVMNGPDPIHRNRDRRALAVGDRDERHLREGDIDRMIIRQVEPSMQRGDASVLKALEQRVLEQIDMEMEDVEFVRALPHLVQHDQEMGRLVLDAGESEGRRDARHELRRRL
jgi:hypothetical protein